MTDPITLEALVSLQADLAVAVERERHGFIHNVALRTHVVAALLASARELLELRKVLMFLHRNGPMSTSDFEPAALLTLAKHLGWTSPLQSSEEK